MNHAHPTTRPAKSSSPVKLVQPAASDSAEAAEPWRAEIHARFKTGDLPYTHEQADEEIGFNMVEVIDGRRYTGHLEADDLYRAIGFAIVHWYNLHPSAADSIAKAAEALVGDYVRYVCQPEPPESEGRVRVVIERQPWAGGEYRRDSDAEPIHAWMDSAELERLAAAGARVPICAEPPGSIAVRRKFSRPDDDRPF